MEENPFPRGRPKVDPSTGRKKQKRKDGASDLLFSEGRKSSLKDGLQKTSGKKKANDDDDGRLKNYDTREVDALLTRQNEMTVDFLHCKRVQQGTLLLGCVREIRELEVLISLPHCNTGQVQANQISSVYTSLIKKHLEGFSEDLTPLSHMFQVGDIVICSALNPSGTPILPLTLYPSVVNKYLSAASFFVGQIVTGAVKSEEEHGYTIDVGKTGIKAFLPLNEASGRKLPEGTVVRSAVTDVRGEGSILLLSLNETKIEKSTVKRDHNLSLDVLQPGTVGMFRPMKKVKAGLLGKFLDYEASICALDCDLDEVKLQSDDIFGRKSKKSKTKGKILTAGDKPSENVEKWNPDGLVKSCLLFVNPLTKHAALSASPFVLSSHARRRTLEKHGSCFPRGHKCDATITNRIKGLGALLLTGDGTNAFCPTKHLSDEKFSDFSQVLGNRVNFPARVLQNITIEGAVVLTLKKSIIEREFFSCDNIEPGSKIDCTIQSVRDNGLLVTIGKTDFSPIKGFVPKIHVADILLQHPEKKFAKGDAITCRVLSVDKSAGNVKLTHKKTLVKSKLPIVTGYDQLKPDCLTHGYIASIKSFGVFINFYNNVHGFVPSSQLSTEFVRDPEKTFYVGQVMKCRVMRCDPKDERAKLSFILKKSLQRRNVHELADSRKLFDVEVVAKKENGLDVLVRDDTRPRESLMRGFLHAMHLSDFPSLAQFWHDSLSPGSILQDCLVVSRKKDHQITRKKSITRFKNGSVEDDQGHLTFGDLKEGLVSPGFILHTASYGVFVQLPGGLVGLCPKSKMADRYLLTTAGYYKEGQSVLAKIIEIEEEKKRFLVSLKESDCPLESENGMESYFAEFEEIMKLLSPSWPFSFGTGKHIPVTLTGEKSDQYGRICTCDAIPDDFTGFVTAMDPEVNLREVKATMLYVDPTLKQIVFSCDPKFLTKGKKIKPGTSQKATVRYMNDDISCVTLSDENQTIAASTLTRTHPNCSLLKEYFPWKVDDVIEVNMRKQTREVNVVTTRATSQIRIHGGFGRAKRESESSDASMKGDTDFGNLNIGDEVQGVVRSVKKNGLLVRFAESELEGGYHGNPVTGRLHISELDDDPVGGPFSMKKYQTWNKIKCKVIGFRDVRTHHFLAITKRNSFRCVLELTLRDNPTDLHFDDLKIGQEVTAFSIDYNAAKDEVVVEATPSVKGFMPVLLLSDDPTASLKSSHKCKKPFVWNCIVLKLLRNSAVFAGKGAMIDRDTQNDIFELKANCVTNGKVKKVYPCNIIVSLPQGGVGKVHICDSSDDYSEMLFEKIETGQIIRCIVLTCADKKSLVLSMRKSLITPTPNSAAVRDKEIADAQSLQPGTIVRGFVRNISKSGVFVDLARDLTGRVDLTKISKYYIHDITVVEELFKEGRLVTCKVLNVSQMEGKVDLSLMESDTGVPDLIPDKLGLPLRHAKAPIDKKKEVGKLVDKIEGRKKKKRKLERKKKDLEEKEECKKRKLHSQDMDSGLDEDLPTPDSPPGYMEIAPQQVDDEEEDPGFSWDISPSKAPKDDSNDSSGEEEDIDVSDVPKKSKKEKELGKLQEEVELRRKEEMLLQDKLPQTALDWDKLVLASPQNSMLWVSYMAFHLRSAEVEKARSVAERAIKTIDLREEKEKWNVWAALLNLENRFGSEDSLSKTMARACQHNDPLKVNFHMVTTFERANKLESAEDLCQKMVRKFRRDKTVWMLFISHLMRRGKREEAGGVFKRSLQSLEKGCHLEIISKFAQLEYKIGDPEHGRVLFENALSNYPKRADIWSVYIDMLIKSLKMDEARDVFDRVITLNMSIKNMRTFFKRYIDFEAKHGTEESVAEIKQKALDYIESKTNDMDE